MNRDLDAEIVEKIYGWKECPIGKDANGENECVILTKDGKLPEGYDLPRVGKIGRGFMAPQFSGNLLEALKLCKKVQLPVTVAHIPLDDYKAPEKLAQACLDYHTTKTLPDWLKPFEIEVGAVFKVIIWHRGKGRRMWVKVLPNDGCALGYKCMIVGGETTKLLHHGRIECIREEYFKKENEIPGLRHTVFEF